MNLQTVGNLVALIREVSNNPTIKKHNRTRYGFKNFLMICFTIMFLEFMFMAEQAVIQTVGKHAATEKLMKVQEVIDSCQSDLKYWESRNDDTMTMFNHYEIGENNNVSASSAR